MIDIEKIADSIRPKETVNKVLGIHPVGAKDTTPFWEDEPFYKQIYLARDIKDFTKRKDYLLYVIHKEEKKGNFPQYAVPIKLRINETEKLLGADPLEPDKRVPGMIRLRPISRLIVQCEQELKQVEDLIFIERIVKGLETIQGENERFHFLFYAKEGQLAFKKGGGWETRCQTPQHYTAIEFAQIIDAAASMIKETHPAAPQVAVDPATVPVTPTRAIALYFYYAALVGDQPVRKTNTPKLAERFGKTSPNSGNDLYNHYQAIQRDRKERVGISGNANADKARLNNLKTAIELLRADNNTAAVKLALEELDELRNAYDKRH